jgi:hypothetical protein
MSLIEPQIVRNANINLGHEGNPEENLEEISHPEASSLIQEGLEIYEKQPSTFSCLTKKKNDHIIDIICYKLPYIDGKLYIVCEIAWRYEEKTDYLNVYYDVEKESIEMRECYVVRNHSV